MKKTFVLSGLLLAMTGDVFATSFQMGTATVSGSGSNTISSATAAGSHVVGVGFSRSVATNTQSASVYIDAGGVANAYSAQQPITLPDCTVVNVSGTMFSGNVHAIGLANSAGDSTASNMSTGTGVGAAQAAGNSITEANSKSSIAVPSIALTADGNAFSVVGTNTGIVGVNGNAVSSGALMSSYTATQTGSLFVYLAAGGVADVKNTVGNSVACAGIACNGNSIAVNATVEGGANAATTGNVTNPLNLTQKP